MGLERYAGWEIYLGAVVLQFARYLLIVGAIHALFWIGLRAWTEKRQVSLRRFTNADLVREAKASFWFVCAISVPVAFFAMPEHVGYTRLYFDFREGPLWWPPLSVVLLVFGQDAYFYWTHRAMHAKPFFKRMHALHHESIYPSAFSTYAMHPYEAIVGVGFNLLVVLFVPLHFGTFLAYQLLQFLLNVYGHLGADVLPASWKRFPLLRHLNRTAAHAGHHRYFTVNYGLYFTFWDRWMGTFDGREAPIDAPAAKPRNGATAGGPRKRD